MQSVSSLIEREECEEIRTKGDAQSSGNGHGDEKEEPTLILLVVASHVPDRIKRRDRPKECGNQREEHSKRLDLERDLNTRNDFEEIESRPLASLHHGKQLIDVPERETTREKRHCLTSVRVFAQHQDDEPTHDWEEHRNRDQCSAAHGITPSSASAAFVAMSDVVVASMPK